MLKFSCEKSENGFSVYVLRDDGKEIGNATVKENTILSFTYADERVSLLYSEFTLRSLVFLLRDKFDEVKVAFYERRFERLGFKKQDDGTMRAGKLEINFSGTCEGHCSH
ncbi:MAG: hypothetical protein IJX06_04530 [Clostridia bacterium]|nr:hypothetical protein [Clostridia bacterium]